MTSALHNCPLCPFKHKSSSILQQHFYNIHPELDSKESKAETKEFPCPICTEKFLTAYEAELHINFEHQEEASTSTETTHISTMPSEDQTSRPPTLEDEEEQFFADVASNFSQQALSNMRKATYSGKLSVVDFYNRQADLRMAESQGLDDGHSCNRGIVARIAPLLHHFTAYRTWLCTSVDHYATTFGDFGWGCGYRNIQMLFSSLFCDPLYSQHLEQQGTKKMPSISTLQGLIERAWQLGFDPQGCMQLGGQLSGTCKWIGATEVAALIASLDIRYQLVDCYCAWGPVPTHPAMSEWIQDYFKVRESVPFTHPLYFQHQGHSLTIVGIMTSSHKEPALILLDPSNHNTNNLNPKTIRHFIFPISSLNEEKYQIVAVDGLITSEQEREESKLLTSIRLLS